MLFEIVESAICFSSQIFCELRSSDSIFYLNWSSFELCLTDITRHETICHKLIFCYFFRFIRYFFFCNLFLEQFYLMSKILVFSSLVDCDSLWLIDSQHFLKKISKQRRNVCFRNINLLSDFFENSKDFLTGPRYISEKHIVYSDT